MRTVSIVSKAVAFVVFSITLFQGYGQSVETVLEEESTQVPYQKLYLQTDREFYFEGDTLRFAAYLLDGHSHVATSGVGNLYVDIVHREGRITQKEVYPLVDGFCSGAICIADTALMQGNYLLRAYTDYLRNFGGDAFFRKAIRVSTLRGSFEEEQDDEEGQQREIDISFLPEGGFILLDEPNCVAFKAVDSSGKGVDVKGHVIDDQGVSVKEFSSEYKGAGKVYFLPRTGTSYSVKIDGYPERQFELGEFRKEGAKIRLNSVRKDKLQLVVQAKGSSQLRTHYLLCLNRGKGFLMELTAERLNFPLNLDLAQIRSGINRFVLIDQDLEPVSERLVFVDDAETKHLDLTMNAESYRTRDPVNLEMNFQENSRDEMANVSIAVIDENYAAASGVSQNIRSYLLLDAELNGSIDSPAEYFVDDGDLTSTKKLDLLMMVNGWRNYLWNHLDTFSLRRDPQFGFTFRGEVKRMFGKKPPKDGMVSMIIYHSDGTSTFFEDKLDYLGKFEFENTVIYDSVGVFAQVRNNKNKNNAELTLELPQVVPAEVGEGVEDILGTFSKIPISLHRERYLDELRLSEFNPERNAILLDEVVVRARSRKQEDILESLVKNSGPHTIRPMETAGVSNIIQYLLSKVPGIIPIEGGQSISLGGGLDEPLFIIDRGITQSVEQAKNYSVESFATIELVTPPMSYVYRAPSGVVLLTTKSGTALDTKSIPLLGGIVDHIKGFSKKLQFYSPKYDHQNIDSAAPDFRSTLYWNPRVIINDGGSSLSFFTCDKLTNYLIFVEGISENGSIVLGEGGFRVDRERGQ